MLNGAYFTPSGAGASASYARASSLGAKSSSMVGAITSSAGPLACRRSRTCQYSQLHSTLSFIQIYQKKVSLFPYSTVRFPFLLLKNTTLQSSQIKVTSHCLSISPFLLASVHFLHCQFISSYLKALCNLGLISIQEKPMSVLEAGAEALSMPIFLFSFFSRSQECSSSSSISFF